MYPKISACLVVRNEEKVIGRCLDSIKNVVNEIIIVHDGPCEDKTLGIARKYTNKIFVRPFIGIAEPHRVFSYQKAKGDWILKIDADEFLPKKTQKKIKRLIENDVVDGYSFIWPIWDGKRYITNTFPYKLCLFRKSKMSFLGFPQAEEKIHGKLIKIDLVLGHKPRYNNYTFSTFKKKGFKWAKIQAEYTLKKLSEIPKFRHNAEIKKTIIFKKKFPLLILIPLTFFTFIKIFFINRLFKIGKIGFMSALLNSLYQATICYYIHKLKH